MGGCRIEAWLCSTMHKTLWESTTLAIDMNTVELPQLRAKGLTMKPETHQCTQHVTKEQWCGARFCYSEYSGLCTTSVWWVILPGMLTNESCVMFNWARPFSFEKIIFINTHYSALSKDACTLVSWCVQDCQIAVFRMFVTILITWCDGTLHWVWSSLCWVIYRVSLVPRHALVRSSTPF